MKNQAIHIKGPAADYQAGAGLYEVIRKRAAGWLDRPALVRTGPPGLTGPQELTYGQMVETVDRAAALLKSGGLVIPGGRVLILYRPEPLYIVAELAVTALGGVIVPADISQPGPWLRELSRRGGVDLVLGHPQDLTELASDKIDLDITALDQPGPAVTPPPAYHGGAGPYCVFFTSGSTGTPKPVLMPHNGILRLGLDNGFCRPGPGDIFLQHSSPAFDASTLESWLPLLNGAAVHLMERGRLSTPSAMAEVLRPVTHLWLTAGLFNWYGLEEPGLFRPLKMLMAGGDVLNPEAAKAVLKACPGLKLLNGYGPTENSTFTTTHPVAPGENPIALGRPVANTDLHLVPAPERGESVYRLWCSGAGLALGYLDPDGHLAADPRFGEIKTDRGPVRAYDTGDLVRLDGERIIFLGRDDRQVKIRGYRVEPAEVEGFLRSCEGVSEAAVIPVTSADGAKSLRAFVAASGRVSIDARLEELPAHLRPAEVLVWETLPLNANGKVDRAALAAWSGPGAEGDRPAAGLDQGSPADQIAALMAEALGLKSVALDDNFFRLGGDSLKALKVMAKMEQKFGARLSLADFFKDPNPLALAETMANSPRRDPAPAVFEGEKDSTHPLTFCQRPFFIQQKLYPESPAYSVPMLLVLNGPLVLENLGKALADLRERHDILRGVAAEEDGETRLAYPRMEEQAWTFKDVRDFPDPAAQAQAEIKALTARPFVIAPGRPLARIGLWRTAVEEHLFFLNIFHGLIDHWGLGLLLDDLAVLYAHHQTGTPPPPPRPSYPLTARLADDAISPEVREGQLNWWAGHLAEIHEPAAPLPDYYADPGDFTGGEHRFSLDGQTLAALRTLAGEDGLTLFPLLAALFGALTALRLGPAEDRDLLMGLPVSLRRTPEEQAAVGLFLNTLPLKVSFRPESSWRDLFRATGGAARDLMSQALVGPDQLAARLGRSGGGPLFKILTAHTPDLETAAHWPGLTAETRLLVPGGKFDLSLIFSEGPEHLTCTFEYRRRLYSPERIARLAEAFQALAHAAAFRPDSVLQEADRLTDEERDFLHNLDQTADFSYPLDGNPAGLMREAALTRPGQPAVSAAGGRLNFGEFIRETDNLAGLMAERGLGPGDFVGLVLDRSALNLAAAQAALSLGAAFIPLDPSLPPLRLAGMVEDAGAALKLLLTDAPREDLTRQLAGGRPVLVPSRPGSLRPEFRPPSLTPDPEAAAYALFTSGSTGRPKGAVNTRSGLINRLWWMQNAFPLGSGDVILHKTPLSFDVSVWELFWWVISGAGVAVLPSGEEKNPDAICGAVARHRVTVIHFVPSMLTEFLFWAERTGRLADLASLRRIITSGESLGRDLAALCLRLLPQAELHNLYGPTEAAIDVTWEPCRPAAVASETGPVPIGRPVANTRVHIVEHYQGRPRLLPPGTPGEIVLAGVQVGSGYLNRPDLTAAAFAPDAFKTGGQPGRRTYHTGDRGLIRPDGRILCLGRLAGDGQIKIRGQRIELEEIEAIIAQHPEVERAVVTPRRAGSVVTGLTAWIKADPFPDLDDLNAFLNDRLTGAMRPDRWLRLNRVPVSASGKLDRRALQELDDSQEQLRPPLKTDTADRAAVEPRGSAVEGVAELWAKVLGQTPESPDQGFFEAGGDSLSLIRLHAFLEEKYPGVFTPADLFRYATVREQSGRIEGEPAAVPAAPVRPTRPAAEEPVAIVASALRLADYRDWSGLARDVYEGVCRIGRLPDHRRQEAEELRRTLGLEIPADWRQMAYLDDIHTFSPGSFRLNFLDAVFIDPAHRLFLETALDCLESHGRPAAENRGRRIGVFVTGPPDPDYRRALRLAYPDREASIFAQGVPSNLAGRLPHLFDWQGPALLVDTACSSGLAALHLACQALAAGDCQEALVGGARVAVDPAPRDLPFISPGQLTCSYDRLADGTGEGEGAFAFLLKPLSRALADGDAVSAVILATALSHDGAASSLTAPNPNAQAALIRKALERAGTAAENLGYVEGHGTGTKLGDPVELAGLKLALPGGKVKIGLGSGKGNFGHLDHAAGFLGLARAMVALDLGFIPPQPWFTALPDEAEPETLPCFVSSTPAPWPLAGGTGQGRVAGVSAFGLSGVNAHVVLGQAPPHRPERRAAARLLLPAERRSCRPAARPVPILRSGPLPPPLTTPDGAAVLPLPLHDPGFWPAAEHLVHGHPALVGMFAPAAFYRLAEGPVSLNRLAWPRMLRPDEVDPGTAQVRLEEDRFSLTAHLTDGGWAVFAEARKGPPPDLKTVPPLPEAPDLARRALETAATYQPETVSPEAPVQVSRRWDCLKTCWRESTRPQARVIGLLETPPSGPEPDLACHPGLLDNAVSLGLAAARDLIGPAAAPFSCESVDIFGPPPDRCLAVFTPREQGRGFLLGETLITDLDGRPAIYFKGLLFRSAAAPSRALWHRPHWRPDERVLPVPEAVGLGDLSEIDPDRLAGILADRQVGRLSLRLQGRYEEFFDLARLLALMEKNQAATLQRPLELLISAESGGAPSGPELALLSGLAAAVNRENPYLTCRFLERPPGVFEMRPVSPPAADESFVRAGEHYLITGGLGGLGLSLADHILSQGGRVTLIHRGFPSDQNEEGRRRAELLTQMRARSGAGERLLLLLADVTTEPPLRAALDEARQKFGPLEGVVHAAGVPGAGLIWRRQASEMAAVLEPKIKGAKLLAALTEADPLRFLVLFSSLDSFQPGPGQADYVAANCWLNSFAEKLRAGGRPAVAVAWPAFGGLGMASRHQGEAVFSPDDLPGLLTEALTLEAPVLIPRPRVRPRAPEARALIPAAGEELVLTGRDDGRYAPHEKYLAKIWSRYLGENRLDVNSSFSALGGDSLTAISVINHLDPDGREGLTLVDILSDLSLADLAAKLGHLVPAGPEDLPRTVSIFGADGALPPPGEDGSRLIPMTAAQNVIWQADMEYKADTAYNLPMFLELAPEFDQTRLENALNELMARHQSLRLAVLGPVLGEEAPMMRLWPPDSPLCRFPLEIQRLPEGATDREIHDFLGAQVKPFDLAAFPLCRGMLVKAGGRAFLYFDIHHMVADGLSLEVLKQDLAAAYEGRSAPVPLEGFANYALWEHRRDLARRNMAAWAEYLRRKALQDPSGGGEPLPLNNLPEQKKRPPVFSSRGGVHSFRVEPALLARGRNRARELGVTTAAFMLGLWALTLGRQTGGSRLSIAIGTSGRGQAGMADMPGAFAANIPLALSLKDLTVKKFFRQAQTGLAEATARAPGSLVLLAEALNLPGNAARAAVVDLGFSYMNYAHYQAGGQDSLFVTDLDLKPKVSSKGDLVIFTTENRDDLVIDLEYYAEAFTAEYMAGLGDSFLNLLEAVAEGGQADRPVKSFETQTPAEMEDLQTWGRGPGLEAMELAEMAERPLTAGLRETARRSPHLTAVSDKEGAYSYGRVWSAARRLAEALLDQGFQGGPILFCLERSALEKIAQAGVLLAGGICVPLNHRAPRSRLLRQIEEIAEAFPDHPLLMFGDEKTPTDLPGLKLLRLKDFMAGLENRSVPENLPGDRAVGHDPAYILFTSGTTGRPKGIVMPHRSLTHLNLRPGPARPLAGERVLQAAAPSFDYAAHEIWSSWHAGADLFVPPEESLLNLDDLGRIIEEEKIGHLFLTPSLLKRLTAERPERLAGLRALLVGGERTSYSLAGEVLRAAPGVEYYNVYGPAETGVLATGHRVMLPSPEAGLDNESPPLGRPLWGVTLEVVDAEGRPVPPWVRGEIVIGGPCVALGYLGQPDLTTRSFSHPDSSRRGPEESKGPWWYRTGDYGRWIPGPDSLGLLEFLGREDEQVKIRGWRVELGAVEELIRAFPAVRDVAVVAEEAEAAAADGRKEKRLAACLLTRPGFSLDDLRRGLRAELPPQEMPGRFFSLNGRLDELPVSPNGKLDRPALLKLLPELSEMVSEKAFEAPLSRTEKVVAETYASVLAVPRVGRSDNFFELGGHSLLAVRIRNQLSQKLAAALSISDIFRRPEVAELAAHIEASAKNAPAEDSLILPEAPPAEHYPSTYAQSRLYLESLLDLTGLAFVINLPLELGPGLDRQALTSAFQALTGRHEALRTSFKVIDGEVRQIIQPEIALPLAFERLTGPDGRQRAALRLTELVNRPFDLGRAPLWSLQVLETDEAAIVLLRLHHILADGWAVHEFYREMDLYYQAFKKNGRPPEITPGPGMKEVALWQRSQAPEAGENVNWWMNLLTGAPRRVDLPEDYARPAQRGSKGRLLRLTLSSPLPEILHRAARRDGLSLSVWLLTHYARLLYRLSGQEDLVIGLGIAGRNHQALERIMGFFMNILPIRIRLDESAPWSQLTAETYATVLEAFDRQTFPFDQLVRGVAPERDPRYPPLFNVVFEYQNFPAPDWSSFLEGPPLKTENTGRGADLAEAVDSGTAKSDLSLYCLETGGDLTLLLEYNTEVFTAETARSWLEYYRDSLEESAAEEPDQ